MANSAKLRLKILRRPMTGEVAKDMSADVEVVAQRHYVGCLLQVPATDLEFILNQTAGEPYQTMNRLLQRWLAQNGNEVTIGRLVKIMEEGNFIRVAGVLRDKYDDLPIRDWDSEISLSPPSVHNCASGFQEKNMWWNLAKCTTNFIPRTVEIEKVLSKIDSFKHSGVQSIIQLCGPSGIGKNELMRCVATTLFNQGWNVLGLNRNKEKSIHHLANDLGLCLGKVYTPEETVFQILTKLGTRTSTLVVIDGSSDTSSLPSNEILKMIIVSKELAPHENVHIFLISARYIGGVQSANAIQIELPPLSEQEASDLFQAIPYALKEDAFKRLFKVTDGMPAKMSKAITVLKGIFNIRVTETDKPLLNTILQILTYCDVKITAEYGFILCQRLCPTTTQQGFSSILNGMVTNDLCSTPDENKTFLLVNFTKEIMRLYLNSVLGVEEFRKSEVGILRPLLNLLLDTFKKTWYGKDALHLGTVWSIAVDYDELVQEFPSTPYRIQIVPKLEFDRDRILSLQQEFLEKNYNRLREVNGFMDENTLKIGRFYAECLYNLKKTNEALELFSEVFNGLRSVVGLGDPITIMSGQWKASILAEEGRFKELVQVYKDLMLCCQMASS